MSSLRVWAPHVDRLEIQWGGERRAMTKDERGDWRAPDVALRHGDDYALFLDGQGPYPDPRSPWQPEGVFGPSRHVDHAQHTWRHAGFRAPPLSSATIYELHVGTFTERGIFDAAIEKLPHLVALGVTHVELLPVNEFPGTRGWGYDGVDLFAPHHAYGGPEALKRLVDACHGHGLAVLLDVVYNHLGPAGNFLPLFGPYFNDSYKTPWGPAVNFDGEGSDEVRRFVCDNALMWLRDYRFDGLRLDAVHAFQDHSATPILEQLAREVKALEAATGRPLVLIAESDLNDPRVVRTWDAGGMGIDAQWSDDFHHALHATLTGERSGYYADFGSMQSLAKAIEAVFVHDGTHAPSRRRRHGRPVGELPRTRFLGYLQNHDQIGNRARGDRASTLMSRGRLEVGAALVVLGPFVPMLFQGEEWGARTPFQYFTDHQDEDLARAVREGRRSEFAAFGWKPEDVPDPQAESTFLASRLDWREVDKAEHQTLLAWHRDLLALRRRHPPTGAPARVRYDEAAAWLVMERDGLQVACNLGKTEARIPLEGLCALSMSSDDRIRVEGDAVVVPPDAVAILAPPTPSPP